MGQILITKVKKNIVAAFHDGHRISRLIASESEQSKVRCGDIFVGYVENIVSNINAAFVIIGDDVRGYLDLNENRSYIFCNPKNTEKLCQGDKIIVQVSREPIKSKPVSLTSVPVLSGKYAVLLPGQDGGIRISSKVGGTEERTKLHEYADRLFDEFNMPGILRTNADRLDYDTLREAYGSLVNRYEEIIQKGTHGVKGMKLTDGLKEYLSIIRDTNDGEVSAIKTDDSEIFDEISDYLNVFEPMNREKLVLYNDPQISLSALYSIETTIDRLLSKRVWLDSGAYLVIEYTEAMTVIDVNSGKAVKGKQKFDDNALKINLEAADEIMEQLRLRNISGMILIDYISMKDENKKLELFEYIRKQCRNESVKTTVEDITALGLVEMTRKRESRPLHEIIGS